MIIKPGVRNFLIVGVMAILFILVAKVVFTKVNIPGVSDAVHAV